MNIYFLFGISIMIIGIIDSFMRKSKKKIYIKTKNKYLLLNMIYFSTIIIFIYEIYFLDLKNRINVFLLVFSLLLNLIIFIIKDKFTNKKNIDLDVIFQREIKKNIIVTNKIKVDINPTECLFIYNLHKEKIIINTELQKKIGYSEKELESINLKQLIKQDSIKKIKKMIINKKDCSLIDFKMTLKNKRGHEVDFMFIGEVVATLQGKILKGVIREFYKRDDPDLIFTESICKVITKEVKGFSVIVVDKYLNYKLISDNHKEKIKEKLNIDIEVGMNLIEILGMNLTEDKEIKTKYIRNLKKCANKVLSGERIRFSRNFWTRGNNKEFYTVEGIPIKSETKEEVIGALILIQDMTENENMKKDLIKSKEKAVFANNAKSQFLANVSHEIRTPMNGILGMTDLLLISDLNEKQENFMKIIQESAKSLLEIINNILDLSKIEAERFNINNGIFNFYDLMNRTKEMFIVKQMQNKIKIKYTIDKEIPSFLIGDEIRLKQILINLIGNSLKFTGEGEINVKVKLIEKVIHDRDSFKVKLKFNVVDTGIGISKEKLNYIFESFTQIENCYEKKYKGTGLGLTITKQLVEAMGGNINVESQVGEGSDFSFDIILRTARKDEILSFEKNKSNCICNDYSTDKEIEDNIKILVAEDNVVNQMVVKEMIKSQGWNCEIVENGLKAVEYLKDNEVDIILMDVSMPVMDGVKAMKIIKNEMEWINAPIVALTAHALIDDEEKFLKLGMDGYLTKPINQEKLYETIKKHLKVENVCIKEETKDDPDEYSEGFERITNVLDGNVELVVRLAEKIINMLSKNNLIELKKLVEKEDMISLRESVHFIKGAILNFQLISIKNILDEIYECTVRGEIERAFELIIEIETKAEEFKEKLNVYKYKFNYFKDKD